VNKPHPPTVSVLLPVYNGEPFLQSVVSAILNQSFTDWELIIVDDGSTDGSMSLLKTLEGQDSRIRLFQNPQNIGLAKTMNRLVSLSSGKYLAVQEQDDISDLERLKREVEILDSKPEVGLVSGLAAWMGDDGKRFAYFPGRLERGEQYPQNHSEMVAFLYIDQCKVVNAGCMFRREVATAMKEPFDPDARMSIDWQFFVHVAHKHLIWGLKDVVVYMRRGGSHNSLSRQQQLKFREARRCIQKLFDEYCGSGSSPINRALYRKAMSTELVLEGRAYSRIKGLYYLILAIAYNPFNKRAYQSIGQIVARAGKRLIG